MSTKGPLRKEGVLSRKLGDEWMLYDPGNGKVHIINATAESVWELCDGGHDHDDIAKHLRDDYQVPDGAVLRKDVDDVIQEFADKGLLVSRVG
jgi:PqqD family protein of HPr-rel-A system